MPAAMGSRRADNERARIRPQGAGILHQDHFVGRFLADVLYPRIIKPHSEHVVDGIMDHLDVVPTVCPYLPSFSTLPRVCTSVMTGSFCRSDPGQGNCLNLRKIEFA